METGVDPDEAIDVDLAKELTGEDMEAHTWVDREGEFGPEGESMTFREALERMLESRTALGPALGRPKDPHEPFLFAGTEY